MMRNLVVVRSRCSPRSRSAQGPGHSSLPRRPRRRCMAALRSFSIKRKKAIEAAEAEAKKNGWFMAIAVVSNGGYLGHFSRMDGTQFASIQIAQHKAKAAATFRRPTKAFQDALAANRGQHLSHDARTASSHRRAASQSCWAARSSAQWAAAVATGTQDGQVCNAGIDTIK